MVAELTDIYTTNVERTPVADRLWRRPKWIETATREPIYSVLDVNEPAGARVKHLPFPYPNKNPLVVVISAVVKEGHDRNLPKDLCPKSIKKYDKNTIGHDRNNDLEEHALYSVVKKRREVRSVVKTQRDEEQLERWLHLTSRRTFSSLNYPFDEMYANENDNAEDNNEDRKDYTNDKGHPCPNAVAVPRGIVGLVGPYRVYQNPNEKREYMLREEELVEEDVVDSVSDVDVSRKNSRSAEPHRRAKWKIREDDEEILVPDIRRLPSSFQEYEIDGTTEELDKVGLNISEWKMLDERCTEREIDDTNFQGNGNKVEGILFDKEERVAVAVDVDVDAKGISSVDGLLTKEGKGKFSSSRSSDVKLRG